MSLREAVRDALKGNDTEAFNKLLNLRKECRERNLDPEKVNAIIRSEIYQKSSVKLRPSRAET